MAFPEPSEDFTADPVELFFDLAFVFAFSQLVHLLLVHPDWHHVGQAALVFVLLWLPWTQFTWSANAVPGNQRSVRILFLVGTAASVPMAAAVESAFDGGGALFAIPLAVIHLMALALMLIGVETGTAEFASAVRYGIPNAVAMVALVVGGFLEDGARAAAWILSILIVVWATIRAGRGQWVIRPGHFAERHALIIIVALGEVIVALGNAVVDPLNAGEGFSSTAVIALVATGVAAAILWWSYFDRVQPALEHRAEETDRADRGRFARDVYTYAHAPIVAGVILIAVGLEQATLHPNESLDLAFRLLLLGGIALFSGGIAAGIYRAFGVPATERLLVLLALAGLLTIGSDLHGVWLIVILDVVAIVGLVVEHLRIEVHSSGGDPPEVLHAHD
ncbi:low temperature requirement protein A [Ilumatobacter sp.]|uniref:low temperature requirement protein A n=1 Tax=Ilumatobacter sp. TaxID=1967498 RepID=UPI003C49EB21